MGNSLIKTLVTIGIVVVLFIVAINILWWLVKVLVPLAILVIAGYIVYQVVLKKRR